MISMLKGIDITLYIKMPIGTDPFGAPVYTEVPETVHNVLVGEPDPGEVVNDLQLHGRRLAFMLGIPKGDKHEWENVRVEFFGETFRTYGAVAQGIESMVPLSWHKKVKVERYE